MLNGDFVRAALARLRETFARVAMEESLKLSLRWIGSLFMAGAVLVLAGRGCSSTGSLQRCRLTWPDGLPAAGSVVIEGKRDRQDLDRDGSFAFEQQDVGRVVVFIESAGHRTIRFRLPAVPTGHELAEHSLWPAGPAENPPG